MCLTKNVFEKAFHFDFVMILAGMYTKCLEMFCFGKEFNFVMIHAGMYTKCLKSRWNVYKVFEKFLKVV